MSKTCFCHHQSWLDNLLVYTVRTTALERLATPVQAEGGNAMFSLEVRHEDKTVLKPDILPGMESAECLSESSER